MSIYIYPKLLFMAFNDKMYNQWKSWSKTENKRWQTIKLVKQFLVNDSLNEYNFFFSFLQLPMHILQSSFNIKIILIVFFE